MSVARVTSFQVVAVLGFALAACSDGRGGGGGGGGDLAQPSFDSGPVASDAVVYGHSASMLYTVDPDTLEVKPVDAFHWPVGDDGEEMTDIALDRDGNMIGISFNAVYAVDKDTAKCTRLHSFLGSTFNGLSFIYADVGDGSQEQLVGASRDGNLYKIDPMTGTQTLYGNYGGGWGSSGDLVSVMGATYATVTMGSGGNDTLVKVGASGVATPIGPIGHGAIWGLGYWKQKLFGFSNTEGLITIDITTGQGTPIGNKNVAWYGAGVTTAAPTTVQ